MVKPRTAVRRAKASDAAALAVVHQTCWRETYGEMVEASVLDERMASPADWQAGWQEQLARDSASDSRTWVATVGHAVVGFSRSGAARDPEPPTPVELWGIYLLRRWQGHGLGRQLFAAASGGQPMFTWVLESNLAARQFYQRMGLTPDGERRIFDPLRVWEIRLSSQAPHEHP